MTSTQQELTGTAKQVAAATDIRAAITTRLRFAINPDAEYVLNVPEGWTVDPAVARSLAKDVRSRGLADKAAAEDAGLDLQAASDWILGHTAAGWYLDHRFTFAKSMYEIAYVMKRAAR